PGHASSKRSEKNSPCCAPPRHPDRSRSGHFSNAMVTDMTTTLGFIGLGVMGEPMCRNLAKKSGAAVVAFDQRAEPLAALARDGVALAGSAADVVARAEIVFLCLPGEPQ